LATAIVGDFDLTRPWLLIAYGLVVYILLTAFLYHAPQAARLKAAVEASRDQETSEELRGLASAKLGNVRQCDRRSRLAGRHLRHGREAIGLRRTIREPSQRRG
jgi:hypothetical protein